MDLIITMAGKYKRFRDEGYNLPKYLLPWGRKSILETILLQLNKNNVFNDICLVASKRDEIYAPHIRDIIDGQKIPQNNLFFIEDTKSQTETAHVALTKTDPKGPVVFHNIDTILCNRNFLNLGSLLKKYDGIIDIFKSSNHKYSYVLTENSLVKLIKEKMVISDKATSGLYGFKSASLFRKYYNEQEYISGLYSDMIEDECRIITTPLHSEDNTIVLGTPSEYLSNGYLLDLRG